MTALPAVQAILNRAFDAFPPAAATPQITNHLSLFDPVPALPAVQYLALYFVSALSHRSKLMEIDFQAIRTDGLKSRIGELRRYL